jgi:hypothetical protein
VKTTETACPFCKGELTTGFAPPRAVRVVPHHQLTRAALMFAGVTSAVACGASVSEYGGFVVPDPDFYGDAGMSNEGGRTAANPTVGEPSEPEDDAGTEDASQGDASMRNDASPMMDAAAEPDATQATDAAHGLDAGDGGASIDAGTADSGTQSDASKLLDAATSG